MGGWHQVESDLPTPSLPFPFWTTEILYMYLRQVFFLSWIFGNVLELLGWAFKRVYHGHQWASALGF